MLVPIRIGSSMASPYKSLINLGKNFLYIWPKKNICDPNVGQGLCIFILFLFPEYEIKNNEGLKGFDFYFDLFRMAG